MSYWCKIYLRILMCLLKYIYIFSKQIRILNIYIYITTYQICSCCVSSRRTVFACYGKQDGISNIMAWNPNTNIMNQGRTKF